MLCSHVYRIIILNLLCYLSVSVCEIMYLMKCNSLAACHIILAFLGTFGLGSGLIRV